MKDAVEFGLKSFFGGCLGCLGAFATVAVVVAMIGLVFGTQIKNFQSEFFQSIPSMIPQGPGQGPPAIDNEAPPPTPQSNQQPPIHVFLTKGENPSGPQISEFTHQEVEKINFWAKTPEGISTQFRLVITTPDGQQFQFGPQFSSDSSGNPVNCGQFPNPDLPSGTFMVEAYPAGSSSPTGSNQFTVTD